MTIQASAAMAARLVSREANAKISANAGQPQIHSSRARPCGKVIQNGAAREKLPSEKRNELSRLAAMEASASAQNTACGQRRFHWRGSVVNSNSGSRITADSLESSASA